MNRTLYLRAALSLWSLAAGAQTVSVPKATLDKNIWVANTNQHIDEGRRYEITAVAKALHTAYQADPALSVDQAQQIVQNTVQRVNSWKQAEGAGASSTETFQKALTFAADASQSADVKVAATLTKDFLALAPPQTNGTDWKMVNAFQYAIFKGARDDTAILGTIYDDAKASNAIRLAMDVNFGPSVNALTTDSADVILSHNQSLSDSLAIQNLPQRIQESGDQISLSVDELKDAVNSRLADLSQSVDDNKQILTDLNQNQADLQKYMADAAMREADAARAKQQADLDNLRIRAADAVFQVLGTVIPGPDGKKIVATGEAAIKIASSISDFVNNTSKLSTGLEAAVLTGNVVGAVGSLLGAFGVFGGGPSQLDLIQDQLKNLSDKVDQLNRTVVDRFDRVDKQLSTIYSTMNQNFANVMTALNNQQAVIAQANINIVALQQQLAGVQDQILVALQNTQTALFNATFITTFDFYHQNDGTALSSDRFENAKTTYLSFLLQSSASPLEDSEFDAVQSADIVRKLKGKNSAVLSPYELNYLFRLTNVLADSDAPVVHPQYWMAATAAYLDLVNQPLPAGTQSPVSTYICRASITDQFLGAGTALTDRMTLLSAVTDQESDPVHNPIFRAQLAKYSEGLDQLAAALASARSQYVTDHQFDPWLPPDQATKAPALLNSPVTLCGGGQLGGPFPLPALGTDLQLFANASHFARKDGVITLCIDNLHYQVEDQIHFQLCPCHAPGPGCGGDGVPCNLSKRGRLLGTAHLLYAGVEFAAAEFASSPFDVAKAGTALQPLPGYASTIWVNMTSGIQKAKFTRSGAPDSDAAARADFGQVLKDSRKEVAQRIWADPLAKAPENKDIFGGPALQVSAQKAVLWALTQVALPKSLENDEELHSLVSDGTRGIFDRDSMITDFAKLAQDATPDETRLDFDVDAYFGEARNRAKRLRDVLAAHLAAVSAGQPEIPQGLQNAVVALQELAAAGKKLCSTN
jgi:hypothetical protein